MFAGLAVLISKETAVKGTALIRW